MSKYSHFEMCEKIFGSRYKFNKEKELVPYSRTDMWDKMIEQQDRISDLETELADAEEHIDNLELQLREQYQLIDEKDEEIAVLEKTLELACGELWYMSNWRETKEEVIQDYIEHFKTKTKEMMKSE